jgi:2-polyprenyl-3-methyl-5-hydroxy-6-metoxy-1,4-benzoquinol methylase
MPIPTFAHAFLVQCATCSFVFCQKIPTNADLQAHYGNYPHEAGLSAITANRYRELLATFASYKQSGNMIDVGSGDGYFLAVAKEFSWKVFGTEFTDAAIQVCENKQITMHKGILNPANYTPNFFDIITSFEVIEHINNPVEEIRNFAKILRKGGLVYVTTPNFDALTRHIVGSQWNIVEYPEHLSYYTAKTLRKLFEENGFKTLQITTTGISPGRLKSSGTQAKMIDGARQADEQLRAKTETNPLFGLAKNMVNFGLNLTKSGDSLKGWFYKV